MEGKRWQRRSKFRGCLYSDSETWKYIGGSYRSPNFKSRGFNSNTSAPSSGPSCYVWWRNFLLVSWLRSSTKDVEQIVCRRLFYHRCCRFIIFIVCSDNRVHSSHAKAALGPYVSMLKCFRTELEPGMLKAAGTGITTIKRPGVIDKSTGAKAGATV